MDAEWFSLRGLHMQLDVWHLKDSCGPPLPIGVLPSRLLWLVGPYSALPGAIGLPLYGEEKGLRPFHVRAEVAERC